MSHSDREHDHDASKSPKSRAGKGLRAKLQSESLEDRILLSATWVDADTGAEIDGATDGADIHNGSDLADIADGGAGNDTLFGAGGDDTLRGGTGDDTLVGGEGNDHLSSDGGSDILDGGADDDTFSIAEAADGDTVEVVGGSGVDRIDMTSYSADNATFGDGYITIALEDGGSFTVEYSDIESIEFSDAMATVLGDADTSGSISGDTILLDGTGSVRMEAHESATVDFSYDADTGALTIQGNDARIESLDIDRTGPVSITDDLRITQSFSDNGASVDASGATIQFEGNTTISANATSFGDVTIYASTVTVDGAMDIDGDLTIDALYRLNDGDITVSGNITTTDTSVGGSGTFILDGSGDQTISANGGAGELSNLSINKDGGSVTITDSIHISSSFDDSGFAVDASGATIQFEGNTTISANATSFGDVTIYASTVTVDGAMDIDGDLTIDALYRLNDGDITVSGNITTTDTSVGGSGTFILDGAGDQTIGANGGTGELSNLSIAKDGGSVTITDTVHISSSFDDNGFAVDASGATMQFEGNTNISANATTFGDVTLYASTVTVDGTVDVDGDLTISALYRLNDGDVTVSGNITTTDTSVGGSGTFILDGSGDQTISANGGAGELSNLSINKDGGSVTIADTLQISSSYDDNGFAVDASDATVRFEGNTSITANATAFGDISFYASSVSVDGVINVDGDVRVDALYRLDGDTIYVDGNVIENDTNYSGTDRIIRTDPSTGYVSVLGYEDHSVPIHPHHPLPDVADNQTLTLRIANVPDGVTLSAGIDHGDGTWTLTPEELEDARIIPVADSDADFTLEITTVVTTSDTAQTIDRTNFASTDQGFTVTARSLNGDGTLTDASLDNVRESSYGLGVVGNSTGPEFQIGYDANTGASEELLFSFDEDVVSARVELDRFFLNEGPDGGHEAGHWAAYKDGVLVAEADFVPQAATTATLNIQLDDGQTFDQLVFTATEFSEGQQGVTWGASDFVVASIDYTTDTPDITVEEARLATYEVRIAAVADMPELAVSDAYGLEDTPIALDIEAALTDLDGSETLSLTVSNVPEGATLSAGTDNGNGTWTLGPDQLDGLTFTPPHNFSGDIELNVAATSTDDTDTATARQTIVVEVEPVADMPELSVTAPSGDEDAAIALGFDAALTDLDGSETLSLTISNVPEGATLSAGTDNGDGTWTLGPNQIDGLTITPPQNFSGDFELTVAATSTDGDDTATIVRAFTVDVDAVADAPELIVSDAHGDEDTAIPLDIDTLLADTDGSETLSLTISNVPEGATLSAGIDNGDGSWTLGPDQVDDLTITPPHNFSGEIELSVAATSTDGDDAAVAARTLTVAVAPVADAPELSLTDASGAEDSAIPLDIDASLAQGDEGMRLSVTISNVPEGATLSSGVDNGDGSWTLSPEQLDGLTITPPANFSGTFDLDVEATAGSAATIDFDAQNLESYVDGQDKLPEFDVQDDGATLHLGGNTWKAVDFPYTVTEDTILEFEFRSNGEGEAHGIGFDTDDTWSNTQFFRVFGTQTDSGFRDLTDDRYTGDGEWQSFRMRVGDHFTGDFTRLTFINDYDVSNPDSDSFFRNVMVYEEGERTDAGSASTHGSITVNVDAVADAPTITASTSVGLEDAAIPLNIDVDAVDESELLKVIISDVPEGATLSAGTDNGDGSWTMEAPQLDGLTITPPQDFHGDFELTVTAISSEAGDTAESIQTVDVHVENVIESPNLQVDAAIGDENTAIPLRIDVSLAAGDEGASLSISISNVPEGATLSAGADNGDGSWTLSPEQLDGLTITPPSDFSGAFDLDVDVTAGSHAQGVNFNDHEISTYAGGQDKIPVFAVEDGGSTLHLEGNTWKQIHFPYTVTDDTILEFQFRSTSEGEGHGIGFDSDDGWSRDRFFKIYGTQVGGFDHLTEDAYSGDGEWQTFRIHVGEHFTGDFDRLTFLNDYDVADPDSNSFFRNVRVYEDGQAQNEASSSATLSVQVNPVVDAPVAPPVDSTTDDGDGVPEDTSVQQETVETSSPPASSDATPVENAGGEQVEPVEEQLPQQPVAETPAERPGLREPIDSTQPNADAPSAGPNEIDWGDEQLSVLDPTVDVDQAFERLEQDLDQVAQQTGVEAGPPAPEDVFDLVVTEEIDGDRTVEPLRAPDPGEVAAVFEFEDARMAMAAMAVDNAATSSTGSEQDEERQRTEQSSFLAKLWSLLRGLGATRKDD
jgi:hypothetical protein